MGLCIADHTVKPFLNISEGFHAIFKIKKNIFNIDRRIEIISIHIFTLSFFIGIEEIRYLKKGTL